jgi:Cu+-exporting ATPase
MGLISQTSKGENKKEEPNMLNSKGTKGMNAALIAKDPVCDMDVEINRAAARSDYQGQTYYFCAPGCKVKFDKNPAQYLGQSEDAQGSYGCGCCER